MATQEGSQLLATFSEDARGLAGGASACGSLKGRSFPRVFFVFGWIFACFGGSLSWYFSSYSLAEN